MGINGYRKTLVVATKLWGIFSSFTKFPKEGITGDEWLLCNNNKGWFLRLYNLLTVLKAGIKHKSYIEKKSAIFNDNSVTWHHQRILLRWIKWKKARKKEERWERSTQDYYARRACVPSFTPQAGFSLQINLQKNYTDYHLFSRQPNHCALHWNQFPKFCFNVWTILRNLSLRGCKGRLSASLLTFYCRPPEAVSKRAL